MRGASRSALPVTLSTTKASGVTSPATSASPKPRWAFTSISSKSLVSGFSEKATPEVSLGDHLLDHHRDGRPRIRERHVQLVSEDAAVETREEAAPARPLQGRPGRHRAPSRRGPANDAPAKSSSGEDERTANGASESAARTVPSASRCAAVEIQGGGPRLERVRDRGDVAFKPCCVRCRQRCPSIAPPNRDQPRFEEGRSQDRARRHVETVGRQFDERAALPAGFGDVRHHCRC